jgi:GntR family transcriptional regulator
MAEASQFQFRLDHSTGVPVYRQIIDQVTAAIATGALQSGAQLPTVRQVAVDLAVNPNTVVRAYRELEIRGTLTTQQGVGTFISLEKVPADEAERQKRLSQIAADCISRAGAGGFSATELLDRIRELSERSPI